MALWIHHLRCISLVKLDHHTPKRVTLALEEGKLQVTGR